MIPTIAKLQQKCASLGLEVKQSGKRPAKDDYVKALRAHFMPAGGLPYVEVEPMLCFAEWNLKPSEQTTVWNSPHWIAQRKLNGCRAILHFVKGKGVFAHSRGTSVKTYRMQELTEQLLFHQFVPDFDATVDCELMIEKPVDSRPYTNKGEITKSSLHSTIVALHLDAPQSRKMQTEQNAPLIAHTFDILFYQGSDIRGLPLSARLERLNRFRNAIEESSIAKFFTFPEVVTEGKRTFFEKIVAEGGEGAILKNLNHPYLASSSRSRTGWVKCKRRQEYDCFVTGFKRGEPGTAWQNLIGALEFSVNTEEGVHSLGWATSIPLETRQKISIFDPVTNELKLHPNVYGKVAEISGQDISGRELRLSHCVIEKWRAKDGPDGKRAEDCFTSMEALKAAAEWVG